MPKVNSDIERHVKSKFDQLTSSGFSLRYLILTTLSAMVRNPRMNTPSSIAFCAPGRFSRLSIGMGNAKTSKSVKVFPTAPVSQVGRSGRHLIPGEVLSQKPARGRQRKKHCRTIAMDQAPTAPTMVV